MAGQTNLFSGANWFLQNDVNIFSVQQANQTPTQQSKHDGEPLAYQESGIKEAPVCDVAPLLHRRGLTSRVYCDNVDGHFVAFVCSKTRISSSNSTRQLIQYIFI